MGSEVSTFTKIFCKLTHTGVWCKDDNGYRVWIFDLLMVEDPAYYEVKDLADPTFNKGTESFEYWDYTSNVAEGDGALRFPKESDIEVTVFDTSADLIKSIMKREMFGFEATVSHIYRMYPSLQQKITVIEDIRKYGRLHRTVKSKFTDSGAQFVSRNVSGDRMRAHLTKIRGAININTTDNGSLSTIDIKTLLAELESIKTMMLTPSSRAVSFDVRDIRDNELGRSRQCILTENQLSLDINLSLSTKKKIHLTTCGDELDDLTISELKEVHNYLSTTRNDRCSSYAMDHYIDRFVNRIVDAIDARRRCDAAERNRRHKLQPKDDTTRRGEEYMDVSYRASAR